MGEGSNVTAQLVRDSLQARLDQIHQQFRTSYREVFSMAVGVLVGAGAAITALGIAFVAYKHKWVPDGRCHGKPAWKLCEESYDAIPLLISTIGTPLAAFITGGAAGFAMLTALEAPLANEQRRWTHLRLTVTDDNAMDVLTEHANRLPDSVLSPCMAAMNFEENAELREDLAERRFWSLTIGNRDLGEQACAWWLVREGETLARHRQQVEDYIERYPGFEDAIDALDDGLEESDSTESESERPVPLKEAAERAIQDGLSASAFYQLVEKPETERRGVKLEPKPAESLDEPAAFEGSICELQFADDSIKVNAYLLRKASKYFEILFSMGDDATVDLSEEPEELQEGLVTVLDLLKGRALRELDDETLHWAIEAAEKYQFHGVLEEIEGHFREQMTGASWDKKATLLEMMPDSRLLHQSAARDYESAEDTAMKACIQSEIEQPDPVRRGVLKEEVLRRVTAENGPGWLAWIESLRDEGLRPFIDALSENAGIEEHFEAINAFNDTHYQDLRQPITQKIGRTLNRLEAAESFKVVWDLSQTINDQQLKDQALRYVGSVADPEIIRDLPHIWSGEIPEEIYARWRLNPNRPL